MRILFLTHRVPYAPNRGDRIRAYHLLHHLARHAAVDLLSLAHDKAEAEEGGRLPVERLAVIQTTPWRNRVKSVASLATSTPLTHTLLDAPDLQDRLAALVTRSAPDVVLAFCSGVAKLALTGPLLNLPLVLDMVDVDSAKWEALGARSRGPMRWIYAREAGCLKRFESDIVARARTTLVVNERERRTLVRSSPYADIQVVPNGIDLESFRPPAERTAPREARVAFCGVLNYRPNEEAALQLVREIWPLVRAVRPDVRLSIVGAHPTPRLRQLASGDPSIEVTGQVPDVRAYLWKSAVSVAPLMTARGLQNKVLEALAAGLPVVTTSTVAEGLPETVLPGCRIADTPAGSAGRLLELLGASEAERASVAASADLSPLTWDRQLAPVMSILQTAASRKPFIRLAS